MNSNYEIRRRRWSTWAYWTMFVGLMIPLLLLWVFGAEVAMVGKTITSLAALVLGWFFLTMSGWARPNYPDIKPQLFFWVWGFCLASNVWWSFWLWFVPWATSAGGCYGVLHP